jgi:hypothetical protein
MNVRNENHFFIYVSDVIFKINKEIGCCLRFIYQPFYKIFLAY